MGTVSKDMKQKINVVSYPSNELKQTEKTKQNTSTQTQTKQKLVDKNKEAVTKMQSYVLCAFSINRFQPFR